MTNSLNKLSETFKGIDWVNQFDFLDQSDAVKLLDSIMWVSEREFSSHIEHTLKLFADDNKGGIALFIERKLRKNGHGVQRFYKQKSKPKRAYGVSLQPAESIQLYGNGIGSVGVTATIATNICRHNPTRFVLHPTAEDIRKRKIRHFVILTDTVGSGDQIRTYLDSMWKTASIKSWRLSKNIKFTIIAYAATESSISYVKKHPAKPNLKYKISCPTISNKFDDETAQDLISLCDEYNPQNKKGVVNSLGYKGSGALIAYAHGMPNNAPAILHKKSKNWIPLFPGRTALDIKSQMPSDAFKVDHSTQVKNLKQQKLAAAVWLRTMDEKAKNLVLVLVATFRFPRTIDAISARTSVSIKDVENSLEVANKYGWLTKTNRLTQDGRKLLKSIESKEKQVDTLPETENIDYYPKSLRAKGSLSSN